MGELRIISGTWRGRWIRVGKGRSAGALRPTSDRVRTSLFDRLAPELPGASVLDLFAGTGALGIEALSRGAESATFVEQSPGLVRVLERNLGELGAERVTVRQDEALHALRTFRRTGERYHLILVDPPYESGLASRVTAELDLEHLLQPGGLLVVEHDRREALPEVRQALVLEAERRYGDTVLTFYRGT
jgi:16S rRNA (guanine(966)-N(2))-methyltransferase RsmD